MNIYLAGKIANKDYRHDIIQNLDNWVWETGGNRAEDYSDVPLYLRYSSMQSDLRWNTRALAAKKRAGWRCQVCNKHKNQTILDAHHRTYERLGWELPSDITVLCRDCHELFESNKRAQRQQATARNPDFTTARN